MGCVFFFWFFGFRWRMMFFEFPIGFITLWWLPPLLFIRPAKLGPGCPSGGEGERGRANCWSFWLPFLPFLNDFQYFLFFLLLLRLLLATYFRRPGRGNTCYLNAITQAGENPTNRRCAEGSIILSSTHPPQRPPVGGYHSMRWCDRL